MNFSENAAVKIFARSLIIAYNYPNKTMDQLQLFDDGLCQALERVLCCSLSEMSYLYSSLSYKLEALGSFSLFVLPCCLSGKLP